MGCSYSVLCRSRPICLVKVLFTVQSVNDSYTSRQYVILDQVPTEADIWPDGFIKCAPSEQPLSLRLQN